MYFDCLCGRLLFAAIREVENSRELLETTLLKLRVDQKGKFLKRLFIMKLL